MWRGKHVAPGSRHVILGPGQGTGACNVCSQCESWDRQEEAHITPSAAVCSSQGVRGVPQQVHRHADGLARGGGVGGEQLCPTHRQLLPAGLSRNNTCCVKNSPGHCCHLNPFPCC